MKKSNESEWQAYRSQICLPTHMIPLNAGSISPLPHPILKKAQTWSLQLASDPFHFLNRVAPIQIEYSRAKLATFFNCDQQELIFFTNISHALNTILQSFPFKQGASILTTEQEYPQYWTLLKHIEKQRGCRFERVKFADKNLDPQDILNALQKARTQNTQALYLSHTSCQTGLVLPIQEICDWANQEGIITIIDGAHSAGFEDLKFKNINPTFYAANCHKWMMGHIGSAFLYAKPQFLSLLTPLCWTAAFPIEKTIETLNENPFTLAFEYQGTRDPIPWMTLGECIDFFSELTLHRRRERSFELRHLCVQRMQSHGFTLRSYDHPSLRSCMVSFDLPNPIHKPSAIDYFRKHGLDVNFPEFEDQSHCLRLCTSWFNTETEIERATHILHECDWGAFAEVNK